MKKGSRDLRYKKWIGIGSCLLIASVSGGCAGYTSAKNSTSPPTSQAPALQIVTTSLPAATLNQSYTTTLGAAGGIPPYKWSATSQLPAGLSLGAQTGTISGSATASGSFNLTVGLTDSSAVPQTASAALTLQVKAAPATPQTLQITISSLPNATDSQAYSAQLTSSGGTAPFTWSVASGQLPSGMSLAAGSGMIAGTTTQSGSFSFMAQIKDSSPTPQVATKSLTLTANAAPAPPTNPNPPTPPASSSGPSYYGSGIGADALCNIVIGGPDAYQASYRFQADHTGSIQALHFYLIVDKAGYSGGNGGEIQVNFETDDGSSAHTPSGTVLATYTIASPQTAGASGNANFPIATFAKPVAVTQGNLYHIVFSNPSSTSTVNYVSVDDMWHSAPSNPVQPTENQTDIAVLENYNGQWSVLQTHTPVLQTDYTDGTTAGQGYMEVWSDTPEPIGGTSAVRETFTNSQSNLAVTNVSVRVARVSGSDPLTVRLEQSDGTLIEQGTVAASSLPLATTPTFTWVTYTFSAVRTLLSGQGYNVVLEAPSTSTYEAYPIRKGSYYNFASNTYFPDGYAEFGTSGSWVGWTEWGVTNRTDGDLQFYFTVTP